MTSIWLPSLAGADRNTLADYSFPKCRPATGRRWSGASLLRHADSPQRPDPPPFRVFVRRCTPRALTNGGRDGQAGPGVSLVLVLAVPSSVSCSWLVEHSVFSYVSNPDVATAFVDGEETAPSSDCEVSPAGGPGGIRELDEQAR